MTALNSAARQTLREAGISQAEWARRHFPCNGKPGGLSTEIGRPVWLGDACGCPDDRCIGYHHGAGEDCGCLAVLLDTYDGPRTARGGSWRGKWVSDMTGAEIRDMAGAAPSVVKIRLSGEPADLNTLAALLASAGLEVLDHSGPRANRYDPGVRVYLTVRVQKEG